MQINKFGKEAAQKSAKKMEINGLKNSKENLFSGANSKLTDRNVSGIIRRLFSSVASAEYKEGAGRLLIVVS